MATSERTTLKDIATCKDLKLIKEFMMQSAMQLQSCVNHQFLIQSQCYGKKPYSQQNTNLRILPYVTNKEGMVILKANVLPMARESICTCFCMIMQKTQYDSSVTVMAVSPGLRGEYCFIYVKYYMQPQRVHIAMWLAFVNCTRQATVVKSMQCYVTYCKLWLTIIWLWMQLYNQLSLYVCS